METLLSIAIALCAGLLVSRFVKPLKLPAVTGYLIAGILIGPYCLGKLGVQGLGFPTNGDVKALSLFNDVALGFIAFAIGNEFRLSQLRHTGKQATVIGIFQALTATLMVDLVLIGLHIFVLGDSMSLADAIVLGAIATATAPAATLMVVRQYKAKGELTDLLLPIVALDDAVGLIVFAISFGVAKAINYGHYDMTSILVEPLLEIVLSILLGFVMGSIFSAAEKYFKSNSKRLSLSITFVILTVALSMMEFEVGGVKIGFSSLLVCMMLGTVFCNVCDFSAEIMDKTDRWTAPLYIPVLRAQRRGAGIERVQQHLRGAHRRGVYPRACVRQVGGREHQREVYEVPAEGAEVAGHHAAAAGRRGAGHVRHRGADAGRGWRDGAQYRSVRRADLRAGRPGADENRADRGRRYPAEGRGGRFGGRLSASPNPLKRDRKKTGCRCSPFWLSFCF